MPSSLAERLQRTWRPRPLGVGAALFVAVMTWTVLVAPRYRSEALLRVQPEPEAGLGGVVSALPGAQALGLGRGDEVETEMGVLRSRRMIDAAIDRLALEVRLEAPAGMRGEWVEVAHRDTASGEGTIRFVPAADARWTVSFRLDGADAGRAPIGMRRGDTLRVAGVWIRLVPADSLASSPFTLRVSRRAEVRRAIEERLDVRRPELGSRLIAMRFDDEDRALAAGVVQSMIDEYLAFRAREERGEMGTTTAELRRQVDMVRVALRGAEEALRRYQEASGLVVPEEQAAQQVKRYAALRAELDAVEARRTALAAVLAVVRDRAAGGTVSGAYRQLATFPALFENQAVQDLVQTLVTLENQLSELRLRRTDENRETRQLLARITELDKSLLTTGVQYREALDEGARSVRAALATIDAELGRLPAQTLQYLRLSRERAVAEERLVLIERQLRQTELRDALRLDQVRVVDAPEVAAADDPEFPRPAVHVVLALILAAAGAAATAAFGRLVRES
jgi:uncharacterized protein involved in exopolysaccharide biosynthesis